MNYRFKYGIVIKNSPIPRLLSWFISIYAITLWPFIIFKDEGNDRTLNHERIHINQQTELLVVGFYLLYVMFWLYNLVIYKSFHKAYLEIPFEKEAYDNDSNMVYLFNRKRYAWKKYLRG